MQYAQAYREGGEPLSLLLARKIHRPELDVLPSVVASWIRQAIVDAVGCMLAGANEPPTRILLKTLGLATQSQGPSAVLGTKLRVQPSDAALLNGTSAHALDYDDMLTMAVTHPSAVMVPALFALASEETTAHELFVAYCAGLDLGIRLATSMTPDHRGHGWHPTGTVGAFCALGAAARLMRLDEHATANAIGIACSEASGLSANFGSMTKPLHAGQAARAGVLAVQLAQNGFTANPEAMEHAMGFFRAFAGRKPDLAALLVDVANPFDRDIGVGIKQFPCCGGTHNPARLTLALRKEYDLTPDIIDRVQVFAHPQTLLNLDRPHPVGGTDAKFSTQYVVARALTDGWLRLEHFEDEAVRQLHVTELLNKMEMSPHPKISSESPNIFACEIVVLKKDGTRCSKFSDKREQRGFTNPLTEAELKDKFTDCVLRTVKPHEAEAIYSALQRMSGNWRFGEFLQSLSQSRPIMAAE